MKRENLLIVVVLGVVGLVSTGILLWFGVFRDQRINFSFAAKNNNGFHLGCVKVGKSGKSVVVNDDNSRIQYEKTWGSSKSGWAEGYHYAVKTHPNLADTYEGSSATLEFEGDQISVTTLDYNNRGYLEVFVDGKKVDTIDQYVPIGSGIHPATWISPTLECGKHTVTVKQSEKSRTLNSSGRKTRLVVFDKFTYRDCSAVPGKACGYVSGKGENTNGCSKEGSSCQSELAVNHLECKNQSCVKVVGEGEDLNGCIAEGAVCQSDEVNDQVNQQDGTFSEKVFLVCRNNSCAVSTDSSSDGVCDGKTVGDFCGNRSEDLKCQGNLQAPAKCFDCKRDSSANSGASEVNILDFSCFAKFYGSTVGKP